MTLLSAIPGYMIVAVTCIALNNAILIGLDIAGVHYVVSSVIAALVIIPASYALHAALTYRIKPGKTTFWRYAGLQAVNTPATVCLLFLFYDLGGLPMIYAAPLLTGIMFVYNYFAGFWAIASHKARFYPEDRS